MPNGTESNWLNLFSQIRGIKDILVQGLGLFFITSSSSHFFNKAILEQYLLQLNLHGSRRPDRVIRQRRGLASFEASCYQSTATTLGEGLKLSFQCWIPIKKAGNAKFCSFWFDQAGNQTKVNRFSNMLYVYQFGHIISSTIIPPTR